MTTKTWDGSKAFFGAASHWSPNGAPAAGDTAVINSGEVFAIGANLRNVAINLGSTTPLSGPDLLIANTRLGNLEVHAPLPVRPGPFSPTTYASIAAYGHDGVQNVNIGTTDPTGGSLPGNLHIALGAGATLDLTGRMHETASSELLVDDAREPGQPLGGGHGTFVNNGSFSAAGGTADFVADVTGSGSWDLGHGKVGAGARVTFEGSVSAGQTVLLEPSSTLTLDNASQFLGSITEAPGSSIVLAHTPATALSYANGILDVNGASGLLVALRMTSTVGAGFAMQQNAAGDTVISAMFHA